jgi:hypothetical protein
MNVEHWQNDTDSEEVSYAEEYVSRCHSVHHTCHTDCPGIECVIPQ